MYMIAILLDVKGAFDSIVHRQILSGLLQAKIRGRTIKFISFYLTDREVMLPNGLLPNGAPIEKNCA